MSGWPRTRGAGSRQEASATAVGGPSFPFRLAAGATVNVKGSYSELLASTAFDAQGFMLHIQGTGNTHDMLIDVAVGAAASEQVILANLLVSEVPGMNGSCVYVPVPVKAGTRISARAQATVASRQVGIGVYPVAGGMMSNPLLGRCTTYGAVTADSGGTGVDPGGTVDVKGAYSEIVASLTNPIRWALVAVGTRANGVFGTSIVQLLDLAVGAAGSEQVIVPNIPIRASVDTDGYHPFLFELPLSVAAGQRLSARSQTSNADASDRLIDLVVYGID